MSENEKLVERLRESADWPEVRPISASELRKAAAALTAAEARIKMLEEALAPFGSGAVVFYENEPDDCVLSLGRWKYQEDGRARFYADVRFTVADVRRARALTQETNDDR